MSPASTAYDGAGGRGGRCPGPAAEGGTVQAREPVYAAIDLGTNNCRLLMASPAAEGLRMVEAFSRPTRLGEGLIASRHLSEHAIRRTLEALRQCALRIERRNVVRLRSVATEACRQAANCAGFLKRVRDETGLALEIISAEEEARLIVRGCAALLDGEATDTLVFDIGGGSTEIIHVRRRDGGEAHIESMLSEPVGVVSLSESRGFEMARPGAYEATVSGLVDRLRRFAAANELARLAGAGRLNLLGTSGTVTTLAGVHLGLPRYDRRAIDGIDLDLHVVLAAARRLVGADAEQRAAYPCVGAARADLIVAGCAIFEAIARLWPAPRLRIADRGVREGILLSMMREERAPEAAA